MEKSFYALLLAISTIFLSCNSNQQDASLEANKEVVKKYHEVWSTGQVAELDSILAPDHISHFTDGKDEKSIDSVKAYVTKVRTAVPDLKDNILSVVAEGDKVVTRYKTGGIYQGKYKGVDATGKKLELNQSMMFRIANGKIAEDWGFGDSADLDNQLNPKK